MARRRNLAEERQIVRRRIDSLMLKAEQEAVGPDADLADSLAGRARAVARRYQMPMDPRVCRSCGVLRRSTNTRVRVHRGRIITSCECGRIRRRPL